MILDAVGLNLYSHSTSRAAVKTAAARFRCSKAQLDHAGLRHILSHLSCRMHNLLHSSKGEVTLFLTRRSTLWLVTYLTRPIFFFESLVRPGETSFYRPSIFVNCGWLVMPLPRSTEILHSMLVYYSLGSR